MKTINLYGVLTCLGASFFLASGASFAQAYPAKPVRVIVPFTPGGGTDFIARLLANRLTGVLGRQFVVDNRPGAGSTIGTEAALRSTPDGYVLLVTSGSYTVAPSLYNLRYDPIGDMVPVVQPDDGPFLLVTHPSLPVRTIKEFIALAKSRPGQISYATSGVGSITHLSTELLAMLSGIKLIHVPYKGTGQSIADTIAGHNQSMLAAVASGIPHVKTGRLRAIAITSGSRNPAMPDVQTVKEAGYQYEVSNWHGMMAPKDTPKAIVDLLNAEVNKIIKEPDFVQQIAADGLVPAGGPPERLLSLLKEEMANWAKVTKQLGMKPQ